MNKFFSNHISFSIQLITKMDRLLFLVICIIGLTSIFSFAQPMADGQDKFIGCSLNYTIYNNFDEYWNQVTPENAGKWGSVASNQDTNAWNWNSLDQIYNYAKDNDFPFRFHVLIWGKQQPSWIESLDSASQAAMVEAWIRQAGARYPDAEYVEVVNEAIENPPYDYYPVYRDALGGGGETGWDWVIWAFEKARQYFPYSKLLLNDYNILSNGKSIDTYITIINLLKERGLIDGVCEQGHYFAIRYSSLTTLRNNLNKLAATGLPIQITEFDIDEADDEVQRDKMEDYFPLFWEHPAVEGITFWGYMYGTTWKPDAYLIDDRGAPRPALEWIRTYVVTPFPPELISPLKTVDEPINPTLTWHSSKSAEEYRIQVSTSSLFSSVFADTTISDTLIQIHSLASDTRYYWRASAANEHGESRFTGSTYFTTVDTATAINEYNDIPSDFILYQNYPNPFNPETTIKYSLGKGIEVNLSIYNIFGQKVRDLVKQTQSSGLQKVVWDGRDASGNLMPSGAYFYKLKTTEYTHIRKMLLMK